MIDKNYNENLRTIANYYGYDSQSRQLGEEMAELTQAINKFWRKQLKRGKVLLEDVQFCTDEEMNIIEEIADVEVCLEQVKFLLQCRNRVTEIKTQKVKRELKRIKEELKK